MSKFTKQEQQKFYKDLQDINIDEDSQLQQSFHEKQILRMKMELQHVRNAKHNLSILDQLKKNIEKEDQMITEYENDLTELHRITQNEELNVINEEILHDIKAKVAESYNNSVLQLADEQYNQSVLRQIKVEEESLPNMKKFGKKSVKDEMKRQEEAIMQKIEKANKQREQTCMENQDKSSMKYQMQCLSELFSERFLRPKLKPLEEKDRPIKLSTTKLRNTFTNLMPQPVNQSTILPKNAPQIALKQLKMNKRKPLKPISVNQVKITSKKIANPQVFQAIEYKKQQAKKYDNKQTIEKIFLQYIVQMKPLVQIISKTNKNYSPKFLKLLQFQQKNINYDYDHSTTTSAQKQLSQLLQLQKTTNIKQLKLTFQEITSVKGIQSFNNIENLQLQFNKIKNITEISKCMKIIELNLSYNKIKDIKCLAQLPWLKYLNIEHNLINQLILPTKSLEILKGNNNFIEKIEINTNQYLRILHLDHNKILDIPKLLLYNLQELNLSNNQIKWVQNLQKLILLKKLHLDYNRIQNIQVKIIYLYLNQLNLSHNYIKKIGSLFLPCLERLYLNNNKISIRSGQQYYLPNLKELNLDQNKLEGFSPIWELLLYSRNLQFLKYNNNDYFLNLRQKIRQIYEYIVYKYMYNLKIINQNNIDLGIKKYYEENYNIYYKDIQFFKNNNSIIKNIQNNIKFILTEFNFNLWLEKKGKTFIREKQFIRYQFMEKVVKMQQIILYCQEYHNKDKIIAQQQNIFYHHDQFQFKKRHLYHLLRGLAIRYKYKREKRLKYYQKKKPYIHSLLGELKTLLIVSEKIKSVQKFSHILKGMNENQAAIKIQKVWRGYIRRKIYKKYIETLRIKSKNLDDDDQLSDFDETFFDKPLEKYEFDIEQIQGLDFQDMIIRPEVFEYLEKNHKAEEQTKTKETKQNKKKKQQGNNVLVNNFLQSQKKFKPQQQKGPSVQQQFMNSWGLKNEELLKTLQYRNQKKKQRLKKEEDKNLTPQQRIQKFRRGGK